METRPHPTHHDDYRSGRTFAGVVAGVAGVFACVFILMVNPGASEALRVVKAAGLIAGALAFAGGVVLAAITEIPHLFARCPSCGRLRVRTRVDFTQSYYPCRRCGVRWTCPCRKAAEAI